MTVSALTAAVSLLAPLTGSGFALTAQAADHSAKLPKLPHVSGHDADGKGARKDFPNPAGARELRPHTVTPVQWPAQATVAVDLKVKAGAALLGGAAEVRAGSTPVTLRPSKAGPGAPRSVQVSVADHAQARQAEVDGLLVGLKRTDGGRDAASLAVSLDYGAIADAYGGAWASRLQLVAMPGCALTTPQLDRCRTRQPLAFTLDPATKRISATVAVPGDTATGTMKLDALSLDSGGSGGTAVAAVAGTGGSQGDYTATDLSASGAWSQTASGGFTYSYPITTPPSLAGSGPGVALSYNSQAVDGATSARNSQSSWIGDGWSYGPGFIERSYRPCKAAGIDKSADECWAGWNATLSLGGHSGELVRDDSGLYHLQSDDGTRIERLTGAGNGLWQGEYFKVTTTDGTAYYLGLNHAPTTTSDEATNSAWGVPVYHPNSGDPCYDAAKGKSSQCAPLKLGWRWNLDFVVDPHGNVQRYDWFAAGNNYAMGRGQSADSTGTLTPYTRGGYLTRISYGYQLADALAGREPSARVVFEPRERCTATDSYCTEGGLSTATASHWPDTPYDLGCPDGWLTTGTGDTVCRVAAPTFWADKRLGGIHTELRGAGGWQNVDRYDLTQVFSDVGATTDPATGKTPKQTYTGLQSVMWFSQIRHIAFDTSGGGGQIQLDATTFSGTEIDNRVAGSTVSAQPLFRPRINGVNTETGLSIAVTYRDQQCDQVKGVMPPSADDNKKDCYPVYWTPPGGTAPVLDWFNKTAVSQVAVSDTTKADSPARITNYAYGDAAWHRDDSELTDDQYRTWNDFRGFATVTTTSGDATTDPVGKTVVSYHQGMDGDFLSHGTRPVTGDSPWLAGSSIERDTYSQDGGQGTVLSKQLTDVLVGEPVLSRARTAWSSKQGATLSTLPPLEVRRVQSVTSTSSAALSAPGTWRTGRTTSYLDEYGRTVRTEAQPDVTSLLGQTCSKTGYAAAPSGNPMMLTYTSTILTVSGTCDTTPSATTTISDRRTVYDGSSDPANPGGVGTLGQNGSSLGYVTATQSYKSYDAQGNASYETLNAQAYDGYGRVVRSVNGAGAVSQTAYTPASGTLPTEIATTNPLGWTAKSVYSPARALVTRAVDANGRVTDSTYDALGRRTAVWLPGNSRDAGKLADRTFSYELHGVDPTPSQRANPPTVTTNTQLERGTYATSVTIYDGFLQARQTQSTPANGDPGRVVSSTRYDSHGKVLSSVAPWSDTVNAPGTTFFQEQPDTIPSETRYVYDGTGRQIRTQLYAKATELWESVTSYPGADRTDSTPPNGGTPSTVLTDAAGRTSSSVLHGGAGVGDVTTSYRYDQRGLLASVADNAGNTWTYGYDAQGNRVSRTDPDAGASSTVLDTMGRVRTATDARGKSVSFAYDLLGRPTGRYEGTDPTDQSKLLVSYEYDTLVKGLPTSATRYAGGNKYIDLINGYNDRYQPTSTTTKIPGVEGKLAGDYTRTAAYSDNLGLLAGFFYNADGGLPAERLGYARDTMGEVIGTGTDSTKLLDLANYNPLGQLLRSQYGERGGLLRTSQTYDDATGRVTTSRVALQESDANPISQTTYGYDQAGSLTSSSELQSSGSTDVTYDTQCFRHDGLNRLTEAWTDNRGVSTPTAGQVSHCTNDAPSWVTLGGPAPYWQSYQYDQLGDRTQQVRHDVAGDTSRDVTQTSAYGSDGRTAAAKPNQLTSVTSKTGLPTTTFTSGMPAADGSTLCLDARDGLAGDGNAVQTAGCNGTPAQRWTRPGDGTLRVLGKCAMPGLGGNGGNGIGIELHTCDGSAGQKWQDGASGMLVYAPSGRCLEIPGWNQTPGTQVGLWDCIGGHSNQQWTGTLNPPTGPSYTSTLTPQYDQQGSTTSRSTVYAGTLPSSVATGGTPNCLDAAGASSANGTAVQSWTCNRTGAQDWTLGTDGTLRVLGACARPVGGSNQRSAQIELWACNPNDASQQWRAGTDGSLVNKASGYCLDIPGASNASGVRVSLWPCNQQPNQKWGPGLTQPVAGSTQSFTYDAEGLTETVTTGTSTSRYLYGPGGNLLLQKGPDGAVLYLFGGAEQLTLSADGTTVTGNRYYSQPDGTNVIRSSGGAVSYELSNPQHTSTLQVDAATRAVTRRAFDPYGAPRGAGPASWADNRGFLGKPVDANSGLDLLGARNYDAALGRFLSVDPVFQAGDPNQMGGYTYSGDNPIDQSDPSGLNSKSKCNRNSHFGCEISDASDMGQGAKDAGMGWQDYLMAGTAIVVFGTIVAGFSGCEVYSLGVATPECGAGATGAFMGACSFIFVDCGMGGHDEPGPRAPRAPGAKAAVATAEDEKAAAAAYRAEQTARRAEEAAAARRAEAEAAAAAESHSSEPGGVPTTDKAKRPKTSKSSPAAPETPSPKASSPHPAEKTNCSFTAATPVLMADGSAKPIGDLKVGDQVESADQATGMAEGGRAVTAKLTHTDEDLLDLDILVGSTVQTVHTTDNHPFWDDTDHQWVPAGKLPVGHSLKTPSGQQVTVVGVHLVGGRSVMYNLTVAQLHTYYVLAGSTPVLVHNTCPTGLTSPRDVIDAVRGHLASARQQILKSASDGGYSPPTTVSVAYDSATGNIGIGARGDAAGMGGRAGLDPVVTQSMPERSVEPWADVEGCAEVGACQELADQGSRRMSQFFFLTVDTRTGSPMVFCGNCQGTFGKAVDLAPFAAPGERF